MGFLDRLLGRPADEQRVSLRAVDVSGDERVAVVGESNYQGELASLAGPKQPGGVQLDVQAVLVAEPDNRFDPNAVAIYVSGAGKVGYLARADAVRFQPLVSRCAARGEVPGCDAVVLGGDSARKTQFCVWLHIAEPDTSLD